MNWSGIPRWSLDRRAGAEVSAVRSQGKPFGSRAFRELRRLGQFGRMIFQIVRPAPPRTAANTPATPARYEELANSLELPDRPMPLTKFERAVPGEAILIGRMARIAAHAVISNYCATKIADCSAHAMRDQHAKSHGCVKAEFIVRDDLPAELTTSLFRPGAHYPAIVRFSNGNGRPQSVRKIDTCCMPIKLRGVESAPLLRTLPPDRAHARVPDSLVSTFPECFS